MSSSNNQPMPQNDSELDQFISDMIAPFSIHRARYTRPHGTVARKQFANRMNKRLKYLIAQHDQEKERQVLEALPKRRKKFRQIYPNSFTSKQTMQLYDKQVAIENRLISKLTKEIKAIYHTEGE